MLNAATVRESWRSWWSFSIRSCSPQWVQVVWTILFNTCIALAVTLVAWAFVGRLALVKTFAQNFVFAQSIGLSIHALFELSVRVLGVQRIEAFSANKRALFYVGVPVVGCLIGYVIGLSLLGFGIERIGRDTLRIALVIVIVSVILSTFSYRHARGKARLAQAEADRERERAKAIELQRQAIDAQLAALQAQIEPHFLFNTLANIVSLIDGAPDKARVMLERLIELLRATLAASRRERTTLGQEAALIAAYLDIVRIRMGARLNYTIDVPPDLADARIPPLSLQPLVENSIKHGLEPKLDGGTVRLNARRVDGGLQLDVEDDGLGFSAQPGAGVGLANLRQRITSLYGDQARLVVQELARGTRVRMTLPLVAADPA